MIDDKKQKNAWELGGQKAWRLETKNGLPAF
jgi:hypothetical protein